MHNAAMRQADWSVERGAVLNELQGDEGSPFFVLLAESARRGISGSSQRTYTNRFYPRRATCDRRRYRQVLSRVVCAEQRDAGRCRRRQSFRHFPKGRSTTSVRFRVRHLPKRNEVHPTAVNHTVTVTSDLPFPFAVVDFAYAVPGDTEAGEPAIDALTALVENQLSPFYAALVQSNIALAIQANEDTQLQRRTHARVHRRESGSYRRRSNPRFSRYDRRSRSPPALAPDLVEAAKRVTIAARLYSGDSVEGMAGLAGYTYGVVGERVQR